MQRSEAAFELRGACQRIPRWFGLRHDEVLAALDLELARGDTLGLVGPNGSGKSTLLRLLAGIDRPAAGEVRVLGASAQDAHVRRRVGYLPEDSPFPPELRARDALRLLASLSGVPRAERNARVDAWLARVGLAERAKSPLSSYSRGMLRRFGLAQALLHEPELLLLDEPTAGLDAQGFVVLDELLAETRARGAAIVIASHVVADLLESCDGLAVLVAGRLVAHGDPRTLLARPGRVQLELDGLDANALELLRGWIDEHGGRIAAEHPAARALSELYRDATGSGAPGDGAR